MQIDNSILELRNSDGLGIGSHHSSSTVGGNSTEKHWPSSWLLPIPDDPPPRLCLIALTTHPDASCSSILTDVFVSGES